MLKRSSLCCLCLHVRYCRCFDRDSNSIFMNIQLIKYRSNQKEDHSGLSHISIKICFWIYLQWLHPDVQTKLMYTVKYRVMELSYIQQWAVLPGSTWSSWKGGCPTFCAPLWVESGRNMSLSRQSCSGHRQCSWRRGCERHPAAPQCPMNAPHQLAASAHLGSRTGCKHTYTDRCSSPTVSLWPQHFHIPQVTWVFGYPVMTTQLHKSPSHIPTSK